MLCPLCHKNELLEDEDICLDCYVEEERPGPSFRRFMSLFFYAASIWFYDILHRKVSIPSNYPWDEGTLQLLKTIHVENVT